MNFLAAGFLVFFFQISSIAGENGFTNGVKSITGSTAEHLFKTLDKIQTTTGIDLVDCSSGKCHAQIKNLSCVKNFELIEIDPGFFFEPFLSCSFKANNNLMPNLNNENTDGAIGELRRIMIEIGENLFTSGESNSIFAQMITCEAVNLGREMNSLETEEVYVCNYTKTDK